MKEYEISEQETATQRMVKDIGTGFEIVSAVVKPPLPVMKDIFVREIGLPICRRAIRFFSR